MIAARPDVAAQPRIDPSRVGLRRVETLGVPVDAAPSIVSVVALVAARMQARQRLLVSFVNPSAAALTRRDARYLRALHLLDLVLPDGSGMSVATRLLHARPARRISFDSTSLAPAVLDYAARARHSVVLIGGAPGVSARAAAQLVGVFPNLAILATFDGFGDIEERAAQVAAIDPDLVICGMGAGTQEAFLLALGRIGWQGCGLTCGGYLDQLAGGFSYYPRWVDRLDLRWIYRLAREPRRLWRRYAFTYPPFLAQLCLACLRQRLPGLIEAGDIRGPRHDAT